MFRGKIKAAIVLGVFYKWGGGTCMFRWFSETFFWKELRSIKASKAWIDGQHTDIQATTERSERLATFEQWLKISKYFLTL